MRFTAAGQHLAAAGARVVAHALRRRAKMRLGIEGLIGWRKLHAGVADAHQAAPLAVAIQAEDVGHRRLRQRVTLIRHHATVLIFHIAALRYCLLNQHHRALQ